MSKEIIITRFNKNHLNFFKKPLPLDESQFDLQYTMATTEWRSIKREIIKFNICQENVNKIDRLFELADSFLYALKGGNTGYHIAKFTLISKWQAIQNIASSIPANLMQNI